MSITKEECILQAEAAIISDWYSNLDFRDIMLYISGTGYININRVQSVDIERLCNCFNTIKAGTEHVSVALCNAFYNHLSNTEIYTSMQMVDFNDKFKSILDSDIDILEKVSNIMVSCYESMTYLDLSKEISIMVGIQLLILNDKFLSINNVNIKELYKLLLVQDKDGVLTFLKNNI